MVGSSASLERESLPTTTPVRLTAVVVRIHVCTEMSAFLGWPKPDRDVILERDSTRYLRCFFKKVERYTFSDRFKFVSSSFVDAAQL